VSITNIFRLPYARIHEVRHLWIALFEHHHRLTPQLAARARSPEQSWQNRLAIEAAWLAKEPKTFVLAAECDAALVGYAFVRVIEDNLAASWSIANPRAELSVLSVLPKLRNEGIGRALLARVYDELRSLDVADLTVDVITTNIDAIRFYEREGAVSFHTTFLVEVPGSTSAPS
jgi:ribosomal protein S18 acetylase RimI-like enzyme